MFLKVVLRFLSCFYATIDVLAKEGMGTKMELRKRSIRLVMAALILFGATVGIYECHEALASHAANSDMLLKQEAPSR